MSFANTSNSEGAQPLSTSDNRMASDNNFQDQSSAHPNPSEDQGGQTLDQGGYGTSASGGDQFARENQTGQGFQTESAGQFKPSPEDLDRSANDNNTTNST